MRSAAQFGRDPQGGTGGAHFGSGHLCRVSHRPAARANHFPSARVESTSRASALRGSCDGQKANESHCGSAVADFAASTLPANSIRKTARRSSPGQRSGDLHDDGAGGSS